MVGRLLPPIARDALAPVVLDTLMPLTEDLVDAPITLVLNPSARGPIERLVGQATGLPLTLQDEPTLSEGQVYLNLGDVEREVNIDRAVAEITAAVRGFFDLGKD